jgi:hypothetical protein
MGFFLIKRFKYVNWVKSSECIKMNKIRKIEMKNMNNNG